jgi:hypothetical protein
MIDVVVPVALFGTFRRRPTNASAHSESMGGRRTKVGGVDVLRQDVICGRSQIFARHFC